MEPVSIRRLGDSDSFDELTALLHRAYAPLAARGMRFSATHQDAEVTRKRASEGECWVGEADGRLVATITVVPGAGGLAEFQQMAVSPDLKGAGLGRRLLELAEDRARALGCARLGCNTSVHAGELHGLYAHHGFAFDGFCDWRPYTNYLSVRFSKDLAAPAGPVAPFVGWDRAPDDAWRDRGDAVRALFDRVWRRMTPRLDLASTLGFPWPEVSTAFLVEDAAHVGGLEIAARLEGRSVAIAGVHAVGTDPDARGKGLGRAALTRALRHVDERFGTAVLTTMIPAYFEPHGFRVVPEHRFRVADPLTTGAAPPLRPLSAEVPADVDRLRWALRRRTPASDRLSVQEEGWFLVIDEVLNHSGFGTLHAADDLGVVVAWQRNGDRAELLDVIGPELPPMAEIAARLPADLAGIDVLFCPDRLDVATEPIPGSPDGTTLMVRGDWPVPGPLAMPLHARC